MIFPKPEAYTPKPYPELNIQEGIIQKNSNRGFIYKSARFSPPSTLNIMDKFTDEIKSFVCNPYVLSACIITYKGKRFIELGTDIYGVDATVKWANYMGNKVVYEVISRGETLVSYNESVHRHKASIKIRLKEIEKEANRLVFGFIFFFSMLILVIRNESKIRKNARIKV